MASPAMFAVTIIECFCGLLQGSWIAATFVGEKVAQSSAVAASSWW
jgi:hypothetical protein